MSDILFFILAVIFLCIASGCPYIFITEKHQKIKDCIIALLFGMLNASIGVMFLLLTMY